MPTRESASSAITVPALSDTDSCAFTTRSIWSPTVSTGFSVAVASWNTMEIRRPRMARRRSGGIVTRSCPSKRMDPETTRPGGSTRPSSE